MTLDPIPVLLYHSVSSANPSDRFAVTPGAFDEHLDAIVGSGRTALTVSELAEGLRGQATLPPSPVLLTFDDGYSDSLEALSRASMLGISSTLYVTTGNIDGANGISRIDLEKLCYETDHVELGAHTVNHPRLDEVLRDEAYREIVDSRDSLEQLLGRKIRSFAYPHGAYDAKVRQIVIDAGFDSAAAVKNALSHDQDDPWAIARWTVTRNTTTEELAEVLAGNHAPMAWQGERLRTRGYRSVRRARRRLAGSSTPGSEQAVKDSAAPIAVREFDLLSAQPSVRVGDSRTGRAYNAVALLIREGPTPIDWQTIAVPESGLICASDLPAIARASAEVPQVVNPSNDWPAATPLPGVSVVVATCADSDSVLTAVRALLGGSTPPAEIIVVENRPENSPVQAALTADSGSATTVKYVEEWAPGLSRARNAGLAVATEEIVAFIDDDVIVDRDWLACLQANFASDPTADCITGLILPQELETDAQVQFEQFAGLGKGFTRRRFSLASPPSDAPLFPYTPGHFGSGANSAFRRTTLQALGGFDPRLGTGTRACGGEDLDIYVRLIVGGGTLVYEPGAIAWHRHPDTADGMDQRAFSYGVGLGAFIGKHLITSPDRRRIVTTAPRALVYWLNPHSRKNASRGSGFPVRLRARELAGLSLGPLAYMRSRPVTAARHQPKEAKADVSATAGAIWSGQIELLAPLLPPLLNRRSNDHFDSARILVRVAGTPVGFVTAATPDGRLDPETVVTLAKRELGPRIDLELAAAGIPSGTVTAEVAERAVSSPPWAAQSRRKVSVVLCTRDRPDDARQCVNSLLGLRYENFEVIIVDSASREAETSLALRELASSHTRINYLREDLPGLSRARNRGLAAASGEIIAFTDDDVFVDPLWLDGLVQGFSRSSDVACVTGLVASLSLEHPAEQYFDSRVWWSSNCSHRLYTPERQTADSALHPYAAGAFGAGANFAFRSDVLRAIGGFDECLGAGSPTRGGEDLDIFVRSLRAGYSLSYEPTALVWHKHRADDASLRNQMYAYGMGLSAYITKYLVAPRSRGEVARKAFGGLRHIVLLARRSQAATAQSQTVGGLLLPELAGLLTGPGAYLLARSRQDKQHVQAVSP